MATRYALSYAPDAGLEVGPDGEVTLRSRTVRLGLKQVSPAMLRVLERLAGRPVADEALHAMVLEADGPAALSHLFYYLQKLQCQQLLAFTALAEEAPVGTVAPLAMSFRFVPREVEAGASIRLSRFALMRCEEGEVLIESPLSGAQVRMHDPRGGALLAALARPRTLEGLLEAVPGTPEPLARALVGLLLSAGGFLEETEAEASLEQSAARWNFHDLYFHSRTRAGRHRLSLRRHPPYEGVHAPVPAVKPPMREPTIPLHRPDLEVLSREDMSLTRAIEQRRSIRRPDLGPLTVQALGEMLYRTARVRHRYERDGIDCTVRPYPGGGGCYELEIYLSVGACEGLEPGLYHYEPVDHALSRLSPMNRLVEAMLIDANDAMRMPGRAPLLITLAARFARAQTTYDALAYTLILKDVGVLYQTFYLVATAMGLAPCALGTGNADRFAAVTGLDYYQEGAVGEFVVGTIPSQPGAGVQTE